MAGAVEGSPFANTGFNLALLALATLLIAGGALMARRSPTR
ncbi:MAG TPA: hypothetical protein VF134_04415 [Candidatus Dormibacteraeota bacterium]